MRRRTSFVSVPMARNNCTRHLCLRDTSLHTIDRSFQFRRRNVIAAKAVPDAVQYRFQLPRTPVAERSQGRIALKPNCRTLHVLSRTDKPSSRGLCHDDGAHEQIWSDVPRAKSVCAVHGFCLGSNYEEPSTDIFQNLLPLKTHSNPTRLGSNLTQIRLGLDGLQFVDQCPSADSKFLCCVGAVAVAFLECG